MSKIINIDMDGTICEWGWPNFGEPKIGVKESLQKLKDKGYYIRIFSCRTSHEVFKYPIDRQVQVRNMEQFLEDHDIPYDEILNINKPLGIFIDDAAIGFRGNWEKVLVELENYEKNITDSEMKNE